MSHLTLETLARLIDETPDPTETGHLDHCAQCREELEAMRADAAAMQTLQDPEPPLAQWLRLEQRLEREGLIRRRWRWQPTLLRAAAAVVIFVMGALSASLLVRAQPTEYLTRDDAVTTQPAPVNVPVANPAATLANSTNSPAPATPQITVAAPEQPAATADEAAARLRSAENHYLAALTRYTELAGGASEGDPLARLAALESIVATTRAALGRAPADPVINGYHLTAVAQRDALLRQVSASGQTWY